MGDFNEVRNKNERFGTIFNVHGANAFNSFISMANLEEVPLGGCSFTWCHRSASKMNHRPILLRESTHDYGPIPFRFFHYWLEMEGFENFVNEVWREAPVDNSNAMINMMNKLKYLKKKIRVWNGMRQSPKTQKHVLKQELADLEMIIDKGDVSSDTLHKRAEVVKSIQEVDKLCAIEASQKAKIKWAIEGDENSKYYHGILNKKRNQLSIRGVLVEGDWVENPNMVKKSSLIISRIVLLTLNPVDRVEQAANRIGCGVLKVPFAYLGSKVGGNMSRIQSWDEIVDKMQGGPGDSQFKSIHGEDGKNGSGFKVGYKSIWRSILQEVEKLKIKDMVLKQRYPRLYVLEVKKNVDVASKLSQENLTWSFRRAPRSGVEQDQLTDLTTYVEGVVLGVTPDRWYWTLDGSGEFSVASARKVIDDNRFPEVSTQTRWIKAVPIKVNIHAWKVRMDCLPTRLNISRR
ncbi:hypothetical protein Tco_0047448, partial [Tanacetum coccineum]